MAKARAIVKRRKAVQNIRKITRTMQLIATARFQGALGRATAARPYTERITELVEQLSRGQRDLEHPLLQAGTGTKRSVSLVITSNRGLCGGYNAALLRGALEHIRAREAAGETVDIHAIGKKGINYFRFLGRRMARTQVGLEDKPQFAQVEPIATKLINAYTRQEIDAVHVTYMQFVSVALQRVHTMQLLPLERPAAAMEEELVVPPREVRYEFIPSAEELLSQLLPETVKVRLFQCFIDAAVSEQVARMVAMKAASDAAADMGRSLTQQYNRARQSQITLELLDIVGGAEALK
jgi:F-type H+-transporting ATPase subunit gamma